MSFSAVVGDVLDERQRGRNVVVADGASTVFTIKATAFVGGGEVVTIRIAVGAAVVQPLVSCIAFFRRRRVAFGQRRQRVLGKVRVMRHG